MKVHFLPLLLTVSVLFIGCSYADDDKNGDIHSSDSIESAGDNSVDILSSPDNEICNGYVIIRDEATYPDSLKEFRYDLGGTVIDFWGNEVFSVDEDDLLFNCGLSPHKFENGLYGYIDINGDTVIGPVYDSARPFVNGSALVSEDGSEYYIDTNGDKCNDKMHEGYNGSLEKHEFYGTFTGKYLLYQDADFYVPGHMKIRYGYSDANGNDTPMVDASTAYSFVNGYAFIEEVGDWYFIDENFERVTDFSDKRLFRLPNEIVGLSDEGNFQMGIEYVFDDGYFVVNIGNGTDPHFLLLKIVPELYEQK